MKKLCGCNWGYPLSVLGNTDLINRVLLDAGFTNELVQNYWSKQKNMWVFVLIKYRGVCVYSISVQFFPKKFLENRSHKFRLYHLSLITISWEKHLPFVDNLHLQLWVCVRTNTLPLLSFLGFYAAVWQTKLNRRVRVSVFVIEQGSQWTLDRPLNNTTIYPVNELRIRLRFSCTVSTPFPVSHQMLNIPNNVALSPSHPSS